ncbi:ATP-binding protein [Actinacidiphila sp. bgisy160]|uniref:ATP-binding protein n=1 Tax=Actinacidiphila sp. bgisy160 TaxID=3413796 RepID=UPI003D735172
MVNDEPRDGFTHPALQQLVPTWTERWRYPDLMRLLSRPEGGWDTAAAATAILNGLAEPVTSPEDAAHHLVVQGEFRAARLVPGGEAVDVDAAVATAREAMARRAESLVRLARRAGLPENRPPGLGAMADDRTADYEAALDGWQRDIEERSQRKAEVLEDRLLDVLDALPPSEDSSHGGRPSSGWEEAVRDCLADGELAAAERLIVAGPSPDAPTGHLTVRRWTRWPWPDHTLDEVLSWYRGTVAMGPEFNSMWRSSEPLDRALIEALADLRKGPTADRVRRFATALDDRLGAEGVRHRVLPAGDGFVTWLSGVTDHRRIARLGLPLQLPLYVGPDDWVPADDWDGPAVWLVLRTQLEEEDLTVTEHGIAPVDASTILELAAPSAQGASVTSRRINLLRAVCRRLRVSHVIGAEPAPDEEAAPGGHPYEAREDLEWWLDLLGVPRTGSVADALLYDTEGHPVVLRAALAELIPDGLYRERSAVEELTLDALDAWRSDRGRQERFHDRVMRESFGSDVQAAVVLRALLYVRHVDPARQLSTAEVTDVLSAVHPGPLPVSVEAALSRVATAGFLRARDDAGVRYEWAGAGLAALLAGVGPTVLENRLNADLVELTELLDRSQDSATRGEITIMQSYGHHVTVDLRGALERLDRGDIEGARQAVEKARASVRRVQDPEALQEDLNAQSEIDLRIELGRRCRDNRINSSSKAQVTLLPTDGETPVVVWGSRQLLKLAFDSLLQNALRAVASQGREGVVTVTLEVRHRGPGGSGQALARIDIQDNGPGVDARWLPVLNGERRRVDGDGLQPLGSGQGVRYARDHIARHGGTLRFLPSPAGEAGALARIELPVTGSRGSMR